MLTLALCYSYGCEDLPTLEVTNVNLNRRSLDFFTFFGGVGGGGGEKVHMTRFPSEIVLLGRLCWLNL